MKYLKSSEEWQKLYKYPIVEDPDGWDRKNFSFSWNEKITLQEYYKRLSSSTVYFSKFGLNSDMSDIEKDIKKT